MTSVYAEDALDVLVEITASGAPITFPAGQNPGTLDPATNTFSGAPTDADVVGQAIQIESDPDELAALTLTLVNPVTLLIAASGLSVVPVPDKQFVWGNATYAVKKARTIAPDGITPLLYRVIGDV